MHQFPNIFLPVTLKSSSKELWMEYLLPWAADRVGRLILHIKMSEIFKSHFWSQCHSFYVIYPFWSLSVWWIGLYSSSMFGVFWSGKPFSCLEIYNIRLSPKRGCQTLSLFEPKKNVTVLTILEGEAAKHHTSIKCWSDVYIIMQPSFLHAPQRNYLRFLSAWPTGLEDYLRKPNCQKYSNHNILKTVLEIKTQLPR